MQPSDIMSSLQDATSSSYYMLASASQDSSQLLQQYPAVADLIKKCHLHSKPQLTCKYCRKYKGIGNQQARLMQHDQLATHGASDTWAIVEITNPVTYNVNTLLRENILLSEYFKSLYTLTTYEEVADEIANFADHAEPYCAGSTRAPSTLFCCLYKLFMLKLREYEVQALLDNNTSPYVRCAGLLYLRYVVAPEKLWEWFSPYLLDDEVFAPGIDKSHKTTIGEYAEHLITEDRYFTTVLPRIPVRLKSQYGVQLIPVPSHRRRKASNKSRLEIFKPGIPVAVCTNGQWVEATLLSIEDPDSSQAACQVQIGEDDDNLDLVDLGLVIILDAKIRQLKRREERRSRALTLGRKPLVKRKRPNRIRSDASSTALQSMHPKDHLPEETSKEHTLPENHPSSTQTRALIPDHRRGKRSCSSLSRSLTPEGEWLTRHEAESRRNASHDTNSSANKGTTASEKSSKQDLMREFRRREQAKVLASGRDYARRPTSYKSSLSLRFTGTTARRRDRSPPLQAVLVNSSASSKEESIQDQTLQDVTKKQVGPSQEHQRRMAQLLARYTKAS